MPADVSVSPNPVDFGKVYVGDTKEIEATVINGSAADVRIRSSATGPGRIFLKVPAHPRGAIAPGGTLGGFKFAFTPPEVGMFDGVWFLGFDTTVAQLELMGEGTLKFENGVTVETAGAGSVTTAEGLDFGTAQVLNPPQAVTRNLVIKVASGGVDTPLRGIDIVQPPDGAFAVFQKARVISAAGVAKDLESGSRLETGGRLLLTLTFTPTNTQRYDGDFTLTGQDGKVLLRIYLQGIGVRGEE